MLNPTVVGFILIVTVAAFTLVGTLPLRRHRPSLDDHLVYRNRMGTASGVATITASAIGAWVLFSPPETATWAGVTGLAGYAIGQAAPLFLLAWLGPRLRAVWPEGCSIAEYAHRRYGPTIGRLTLAIVVFYLFIYLTAEITAISQAVRILSGMPLHWTALLVTAGTVAYTTYGGLRASIVTDAIQFALILPLTVAVFVGAEQRLGGIGQLLNQVHSTAPQLLSWSHAPGISFALTLIIAISAANLFHQGFWQRVYASYDERTARRAYLLSGALTMPLVAIPGSLGLLAVAQGLERRDASVALFAVAVRSFPPLLSIAVLVLSLALVMSSVDTLLNGMVSTLVRAHAVDRPDEDPPRSLRRARLLTVALAVPAAAIAARGYSVLYLFLIADLICSGAAVPMFYGLASNTHSARTALRATLAGIAIGALYFPKPDFSPWTPLPGAGNFLLSFGLAVLASSLATALGAVRWSLTPGPR